MSRRGTRFAETMLGTARLEADGTDRRARLDLRVGADSVLRPLGTTEASLTGRIRIAGWADDAHAVGELEISPLARRRIRYRLTFTAEGRRLTLDGWKSITPLRPVRSMTVLPFTLYETYEDEVRPVGAGTLRFPLAGGLAPFLMSFRFPRREDGAPLMAPRWDGRAGRTEVWYTTATDPVTAAACGCTTNWSHPPTARRRSLTAGRPSSPRAPRTPRAPRIPRTPRTPMAPNRGRSRTHVSAPNHGAETAPTGSPRVASPPAPGNSPAVRGT
ncbi:hypothetical protein [Streptomyces sp. NPDC057302]|uniref:hypothetical protein n=1 Tax=Streptomyces sp. NPDC057302 TaxID=3346094 RepID=UPI00363A0D45